MAVIVQTIFLNSAPRGCKSHLMKLNLARVLVYVVWGDHTEIDLTKNYHNELSTILFLLMFKYSTDPP